MLSRRASAAPIISKYAPQVAVNWNLWEAWSPVGGKAGQKVRDLISAVTWLHATFEREIWLWRGQSSSGFTLEPGMHSRLRASGLDMDEDRIVFATDKLIHAARNVNSTRSMIYGFRT